MEPGGDGTGVAVSGPPLQAMPSAVAEDGAWVRARPVFAPPSDRVLFGDAPSFVAGQLAVIPVELTKEWRYSVNGYTVDPSTIEVVEPGT